jgi:acetyl esterase/lipase
VAYGGDAAQRFDVYAPREAKGAPVIFMVHGGSWFYGDKRETAVVEHKVERWAPKGYVFISVNYRMVPKADPLEQARDVARALAFAQSRAKEWGGDPSKFILMGHSAGAHLVGLLSANPAEAVKLGAKPWLGADL